MCLRVCTRVRLRLRASTQVEVPSHSCIWARATADEKQASGLFETVLRLKSPRTVKYKLTNQPVINNVLKPFIQGIMLLNTSQRDSVGVQLCIARKMMSLLGEGWDIIYGQ